MLLRLSLLLQVDTAVAEETRNAVQAEETKAKKKAQKAQAIADDAQKDLAEALPALDAALASLRKLNKNDVTEVTDWGGGIEVLVVMEGISEVYQGWQGTALSLLLL